ncbi:hypothetical protein Tco_0824908 [Tanacetum coccineum]
MEYLVKISKKARILELKQRYFKDYYSDILYARRPIRRIEDIEGEYSRRYQAWSLLQETLNTPVFSSLNMTYLLFDKFSSLATLLQIRVDDDFHNFRSVETEFPAIVIDDTFTSHVALSCESKVSPPINDEIDFTISFDESDDEDYAIICDKNSFSYKMISVDNLKTDSENDNEKIDIPSFPLPEPTISYLHDLDFLKVFKNEFPAIVCNGAQKSKSDDSTEPTLSPQHIDEFDLKDKTS